MKWASRIQDLFTIIKTLTLILIILTGLVVIGRGKYGVCSVSVWALWGMEGGVWDVGFYLGNRYTPSTDTREYKLIY